MRIIEDELNISVPVSTAFNWFKDLDKNYLKWHPPTHENFVWLSDKPIGKGSRFSFEESIKGNKHKMLMEVSEYIENKKLSFVSLKIEVESDIFPDRFLTCLSSLFRIRIEMIRTFASVSENSTKIHTTHRFGSNFPVIGTLIETFINIFVFSSKNHELHMKEEGEYMKMNLESL
ncbi:MAG: hypothetical protein K9K65_16245 [Desulfarculaceae bacterium]|nr:hypothetical protein [Desulfarculaceae bacterium]MCF8049508.1 hypothetical protein [Desulfarculaceae bacterium]MCF8099390.1 hypothetical protein [Desulfarculaceae bacterium]MCF8124458.1 hypothetical protein [Desulfarculaceae bacterium]